MIVVMPNDGPDGSYSDWYGSELIELGQPPAWESFHTGELLPWIDAHYRTIAAPGGRFIAGLSSGGAGAMKYASAHPGLFGAAGEFSGAVDADLPGFSGTASLIWDLGYLPGFGPPGHCTWGDPAAHEVAYLPGLSPGGLTAAGSGTLGVTTAAAYRPGATYALRAGAGAGAGAGATTRSISAGPDGRLRFGVDLGPSHLQQQTEFGPGATAGWSRVTVSIAG